MARIIGDHRRMTDESRKQYGPKHQAFLDNMEPYRDGVIDKFLRRRGLRKTFTMGCPGRPWPFPER